MELEGEAGGREAWAANETTPALEEDMTFNSGHVVTISCYSVLMCVSAAGNLGVLATLSRKRGRSRSRVNLMLMHLAIADLLVTFLMLPLEIAWAATVSWRGGDAMCRIMAVCRVFGLFLSSFVLVCISMDRYFAILRPMSVHSTDVDRRSRMMLIAAWCMSLLCSVPQALVFSVQQHPQHPWYKQCLTWGTLKTHRSQVLYAIFSSAVMYGLPLLLIIFAYVSILGEIFRRSRETANTEGFRRSSLGFLGKARSRTLKMTLVIVMVFFICWTPYNIMSVWYWLDRDSATKVDQRIQRGLFIFACTNSCVNPIVYSVFNVRRRGRANGSATGASGQVRNRQRTFSSSERPATLRSYTQPPSIKKQDTEIELEEWGNGNGTPMSEFPQNSCNGNNHRTIIEDIKLT